MVSNQHTADYSFCSLERAIPYVPKAESHNRGKCGSFHKDNGMVGLLTFFPTKTKPMRRTTEVANKLIMKPLFHPCAPPLESTNESNTSLAVDRAAPI